MAQNTTPGIPVHRSSGSVELSFTNGWPKADQTILIHSTAPDMQLAKRIAHILVEEGLAACVNLGAESLSMYMWQGVLEGATEVAMTIKTRAFRMQEITERLAELHPYEVPELLIQALDGGSRAYLEWLAEQTQPNKGTKE